MLIGTDSGRVYQEGLMDEGAYSPPTTRAGETIKERSIYKLR